MCVIYSQCDNVVLSFKAILSKPIALECKLEIILPITVSATR